MWFSYLSCSGHIYVYRISASNKSYNEKCFAFLFMSLSSILQNVTKLIISVGLGGLLQISGENLQGCWDVFFEILIASKGASTLSGCFNTFRSLNKRWMSPAQTKTAEWTAEKFLDKPQATNDKQSPKHKLGNWTNRWSKVQTDARCRNFTFRKQVMPFPQHLENLLTLNKFFPTKLKEKENMQVTT